MGMLRTLAELVATFRSADVVVLCYHRVRSRERFHAQMKALAEYGYSILTMAQFTEWLNGSPLPSRPAALLTFDHCYPEQLEAALPVLDSLRCPATFFPASRDSLMSLATYPLSGARLFSTSRTLGTLLAATRTTIQT